MSDGAGSEDVPFTRVLRHFHNPLQPFTSSRVTDLPGFIRVSCSAGDFKDTRSSVLWGTRFTDPATKGPAVGNPFDRDAARAAYLQALTLLTSAGRHGG